MPPAALPEHAGPAPYVSVLSDISTDAPAFERAYALSTRAAAVGFRWPNVKLVLKKIAEELGEVKKAVVLGDRENTIEETGDLLGAVVTLVAFTNTDRAVLSGITAGPDRPGDAALMAHIDQSLGHVGAAIEAGDAQMREAIRQLLTDIATFAAAKGIDPEKALQRTNDKFTYRFDAVGAELHAEGRKMAELDVKELIRRWNKYKPEGPQAALKR